jgi:DNA helicase-2/ATP-dependent DNA helicase PcrA
VANELNNCYLINAPAGSGKTTEIKSMVQRCIIDNPKDNILCITYTNRAADELSKDVLSKNVFIGTIHSFLHSFLKTYFAHQNILELYFEIYGARISERIENKGQKDSIAESNARYIEKYGKLDYDTVRKNIKVLSYNESPFSSLYYGGLSHDDLISFSKAVFNRYPVVGKRISSKYQFIFIDEYQDTMSDVLKIFFESVHNTKTKLFLFGDRMQQIYKNYDGSFEESFELFDTTKALTTNHRSTKNIVDILNKIYNDPAFVQNISEKMRSTESDFDPRIIISHSIQAEIENLRKADPDTLILYLFNKERFSDIDAIHLYDAFNSMEKYSFGKAVSAVDVLTTRYEDNPDALLKVLFCVVELLKLYKAQQYGSIIQILKGNKSIFSKDSWNIQTHNDKETVFNSLKRVFDIMESGDKTIADLISRLADAHLLNEAYLSGIVDDDDYKLAELVPVIEVVHVADYLCNPRVSTQHGVKGESHDSVVFVAEDSSGDPRVAMYRFFEMWGQIQISAKMLNRFYYDFAAEVGNVQRSIGIKASDLKKDTYAADEEMIKEKIHTVFDRFKDDLYFQFIYGADYESYFSKPGVTKAKDCLKDNTAYSILSAYKLFYVGCSRARKNLTILLDSSKIQGNLELQKKRFEEIGFQVISSPTL